MYLWGRQTGSHGRNTGDSLVEEGLEDDHLVAGLDESHEGTQHTLFSPSATSRAHNPVCPTFICTSGDGNLGVRVESPAKGRRVGIGDSFLQTRASLIEGEQMFRYGYVAVRLYLGGGVLVAVDTVKGLLGGIQGELGRVIATARVETWSETPVILVRRFKTHKKPCPMFTMGWTGEAAAASLTMDLRSGQTMRGREVRVCAHRTRHPVSGQRLWRPV